MAVHAFQFTKPSGGGARRLDRPWPGIEESTPTQLGTAGRLVSGSDFPSAPAAVLAAAVAAAAQAGKPHHSVNM